MQRSSSSLPRHAASLALAIAAAMAALLPIAASAQRVLPPPTYRIGLGDAVQYGQYQAPGNYSVGGASISATPFPQPALAGGATGNPSLGAGLEGDMTYFFAVDGPENNVLVPLLVTFAVRASVEGAPADASASAAFGISFTHHGDFNARVEADAAHPAPLGIFDTRAFEMLSGGAIAHASLSIRATSFDGLAQAFADPFIFIQPTFLTAHPGYTVSVSPGIGNAPFAGSVPEPETWATMLLGLGFLATASRRRQRGGQDLGRKALGRLLLLGAGLLAGTAARADEDPLPPTLMPVQFSLQAQSVYLANEGIASSNLFFASGSLGGTGPRVAVHGDGPSSVIDAENRASASALWSFQIAGPAGVVVPILITGLYSFEMNNASGVSGGVALGVDRFRLGYVMSFSCMVGDESGCDSSHGGLPQDFVLHEAASSGVLTFIQIATGGALRGRGHIGEVGSFNAFIDPLISIDPAFARAGEFTLYVSPGAGGFVATVPEPETYATMLLGLGVLAATSRRRQRGS